MFQIMNSGTITMTLVPETTPATTRSQLVHSFMGDKPNIFDAKLCFSQEAFVIQPCETHMLIPNFEPVYRGVPQGRLALLCGFLPVFRVVYNVTLKYPDLVIKVDHHTPLALLLLTGCLEVTTLVSTQEELDDVLMDDPSCLVIDQ